MKFVGLLMASAALVTLAACSGGTSQRDQQSLGRVATAAVSSAVSQRRAGPRQRVTVTRKMLDATKEAALQVEPEIAGGTDFLRRIARRSDSEPGQIEIWKSSDNAHLYLRGGVFIGSRGVGGDVISAEVGPTVAAVAARRSGGGERRMVIDRGDLVTQEIRLACQIDNLGPERIGVVYKEFNTVHLRERCVGGPKGETEIVNDYWVQPGGVVRKSRQWIGPVSGYFDMLLLKN